MSFDDVVGSRRGSHPPNATTLLEQMQFWPQRFADFASAIVGLDRYELAVARLVARGGVLAAERKLWTIESSGPSLMATTLISPVCGRPSSSSGPLWVPLVEELDSGPQLRMDG